MSASPRIGHFVDTLTSHCPWEVPENLGILVDGLMRTFDCCNGSHDPGLLREEVRCYDIRRTMSALSGHVSQVVLYHKS